MLCSPELNKFDLHSHTSFSDGDLSPAALLRLAQEHDITHLAVTDHDSVAGLPQARTEAAQMSITLIEGIEFSCEWNGQLLHVLGLNIDPAHDQLLSGIAQNQRLRQRRAERMHEDFIKHGIDLTERVSELVGEHGVPTRPHFAQALVEQGIVSNKNQAFKRYLVKGKVGFVPMPWPELAQVATWITAAGGQAVLAHPTRYKFSRTKLVSLIETMCNYGVRALEVSTPITEPKHAAMLTDLCLRYDLAASIGSDFHSQAQPWARLGGAPALDPRLQPIWSRF